MNILLEYTLPPPPPAFENDKRKRKRKEEATTKGRNKSNNLKNFVAMLAVSLDGNDKTKVQVANVQLITWFNVRRANL